MQSFKGVASGHVHKLFHNEFLQKYYMYVHIIYKFYKHAMNTIWDGKWEGRMEKLNVS